MITSYVAALKYLYDNLPMFQRVGAAALKKDLHNTIALCKALGDPQQRFRSIHVAGTNGKGSTSHMMASILQAAGYKTGLYTSPHLKEFTERIRINGSEVDQPYVLEFVNRIRPFIEDLRPSFFEITVAMAFDYFARNQVDIAVIETGLGGRLDSTNVITPLVSLITNISWDHKELLGNTLPEIASEKAGIIKYGRPVVISERQPDLEAVFIDKAGKENAPIFFASDEYHVESGGVPRKLKIFKNDKLVHQDVAFPLLGNYQKKNVAGVLRTIDALPAEFSVTEMHLREGLETVVAATNLKGRWQVIGEEPMVVCDTAHNFSGVQEVMQQLSTVHYKRLHLVWGMVKDKDISNILSLLPKHATYYFCQAQIPRAMEAGVLLQHASHYGLSGSVIPGVNDALHAARSNAGPEDAIFVGGSTFVVAEISEI